MARRSIRMARSDNVVLVLQWCRRREQLCSPIVTTLSDRSDERYRNVEQLSQLPKPTTPMLCPIRSGARPFISRGSSPSQ